MLARKIVNSGVRRVVAQRVASRAAPSFSTLLDRKEKAEESRYIKDMETKRNDEMRKKVEALLSQDADHHERQQLENLLEKKEEKRSLLAAMGDWRVAVPVGIFAAIPALANGFIVIDPALQMTGSFLLFLSAAYLNLGPGLHKSLVETGAETAKDVAGVDKAMSAKAIDLAKDNEERVDLVEEYKAYTELVDSVAAVDAQNRTNAAEHEYSEKVQKKLAQLHLLEESVTSAVRNRTISFVKADVVQRFTQDNKARDDALNAAIAALAGGDKLGKDVVGDVFSSSLRSYTDKYVKADPKSDSILVQLEKDVSAVVADLHGSGAARQYNAHSQS